MKSINIKGPIIENGEKWIYNLFEADAICPNDVIRILSEGDTEVVVTINSGGGRVDCGNEIYTALKSYTGHVTVDIVKAGSAASVIAMAGDLVRISPVGQVMIHNVSCGAIGDYRAMDKASEVLKKTNQSLANAYQLKTGLPKEQILTMMDAETWLTAEEAKAHGFVDEILFEEESIKSFAANCSELLPMSIVKKMQNLKQGNMINSLGAPDNAIEQLIEQAVEKAMKNRNKNPEPQNKDQKGTDQKSNRFFFYY